MSNIYLRQSTAGQVIDIGPILDIATLGTPYTTVLANTDIKLRKLAGTSLTSKNSGGSTHISGGLHYCTLDATDTNTIGALTIYTAVASQTPTKDRYWVAAANVYDSLGLGAGTDLLDVSLVQIGGSAAALAKFLAACTSMVTGTAVTGTLSNTQATTSLGASYATDNQLVNRWVIWLGDVTAQLSGQGSQISAFNGTTKLLSYGPIAGGLSPANLDSFVVL